MATFVELCAGTAAITFALFEANPPVPMAGSKRTLASQIVPLLKLERPPERVILNDPGEWGRTLAVLFGGGWEAVASMFDAWAADDARILFDRLRSTAPSPDPVERAATHLYLQTRTYRGKPVYPRAVGAGWVTHGFDSEYRIAVSKASGAKDRGWFNARPALAKKLRALAGVRWPVVEVHQRDGLDLARELAAQGGLVVLVDPPYEGTTGYGTEFPRSDVMEAAKLLAARNRVVICENTPLGEIAFEMATRKLGTQLSSKREFVTVFGGALPAGL